MNNSFYNKNINSIGLLTTFSILIWYLGPLLPLGTTLLHYSEGKILAISSLFFLWLLKMIFLDSLNKHSVSLDPSTEKNLKILKNRLLGALNFLKKTTFTRENKNIPLSTLPWYLLIGPPSTGKTTLLANTNINYILSKQLKQINMHALPRSESIDFWVTRELTLIDIPSRFLSSPAGLWKGFISLIQKYRGKNAIQGIIVALPIAEIMEQTQKWDEFIHSLSQRLNDIQNHFGFSLPIYLVLTKCDKLRGFTEFFKNYSDDELAQAWGITLPKPKHNENLIDIFLLRFNFLIKRLNKQLIWRLHQERNLTRRSLIKAFPLQIEALKETTAKTLRMLSSAHDTLDIRGIYLTSAIQPVPLLEHSDIPLALESSSLSQSALQIFRRSENLSKAHFIKQLLLQDLPNFSMTPLYKRSHKKIRLLVYVSSALLIIASGIFLGKNFKDNLAHASLIQAELSQYHALLLIKDPETRLQQAVPILEALQTIQPKIKMHFLPQVYAVYTDKLQKTAKEAYQQALQTIVLPGIKSYFEQNLHRAENLNPEELYATLKAYLMLGNPTLKDSNFLSNVITQLFLKKYTAQENYALLPHVKTALTLHFPSLLLDKPLIETARKKLASFPSDQLGFAILKSIQNNNRYTEMNLGINMGTPPALISPAVENQIPHMFTAEAFPVILSQQIPSAVDDLLKSNWVLSDSILDNKNPVQAVNLVGQLQTTYINRYVDIWESLLANIKLNKPKNLIQTNALIANLISEHSPLLQLLQSLQQNTHFSAIMSASPKLQGLNNFSLQTQTEQNNSLYAIFLGLRSVHQYLEQIITSPNIELAAYTAMLKRMDPSFATEDPLFVLQNITLKAPEPLKDWLTNITNDLENHLLQEAMRYIDHAWQHSIFDMYQTQIANHYPFSNQTDTEVNLTQFVSFFGHSGTLTQFYQQYLQPFVDTSHKHWHWKTMNGHPLPFSTEALRQIQHAFRIQRAFFPNGDDIPHVSFTLQPLTLGKNLAHFSMAMNGQSLSYEQQSPLVPHRLSWPGNPLTRTIVLQWTSADNKIVTHKLDGEWAWFHLVDQTRQDVMNRKKIVLYFSENEYKTKFALFTEGHFNPFLPLNFRPFYLPEQLSTFDYS